jgi:hypothetical protein
MHRSHGWLVRAVFEIAAVLEFTCQPAVRAQDIAAPDLWDIATGERIPGAEVQQTKDFGAVVAGLPPKGGFFKQLARKRARRSMDAEGFQPGDLILGVDGMRTYGWREFELARFRNSLSTTMTLLINRNGDLQWIKLNGLTPGRKIGTQIDAGVEEDRFVKQIETLGINVDDKVRDELYLLPPRASAELAFWSAAQKSPGQDDTAWIQDFIALYAAVQGRHYSGAAAPARQPPIAYFQRLEKFYLELAAANQPTETPPSLDKSGETPEFYVLALPVPDYKAPLGDLNLSDRRFKVLLARSYAQSAAPSHWTTDQPDEDLASATDAYANSKAASLDVQFLDKVRAAALDDLKYGSLPFDNDIVQNTVSRTLLMQQFSGKLNDEKAPDWPLYAFAMIPLNLHAHNAAEAARILGELAKVSPYLARTAGLGASLTRPFLYNDVNVVKPVLRAFVSNDGFLGPDVPAVFRWALEKVAPVAITYQEVDSKPPPGPYTLLTVAPYAELLVLKGLPPPKPATVPAATPGKSPPPIKTGTNSPG